MMDQENQGRGNGNMSCIKHKEGNAASRSEEQTISLKKITALQQGPLIQFSLLLFSIIWSVAKQSEGDVPPACDCQEPEACLNICSC